MSQKPDDSNIPADTVIAKATIQTKINYSDGILHRAGQFHKNYKNHQVTYT